jgi:uncharacterized protein
MTVGPVLRDGVTAAFFDGTARNEFLLRSCTVCPELSTPQAEQCQHCGSSELGWAAASGKGSLVSWTVNHSPPAADGSTQRSILGIVQLAEGPWWWTAIVDVDPDQLAADMPLTVRFERNGDEYEAVPMFATAAPDAR